MSQIAEVERELDVRAKCYPRLVACNVMRQDQADLHVEYMHAVLATLQWLQKHDATIRAVVAGNPEHNR